MAIIGQDSGTYTKADADRKRALAKQLMGSAFRAKNPLGALAMGLEGSISGLYDKEASGAEAAGSKQIAELLQGKDYTGVLGNEWANPQQAALASMLQGREWEVGDRNQAWAREDAIRAAEAANPNSDAMPATVREWEYFNALPDDQKGEYIRMKRANPYLDIGTGFVQPDPLNPGSTAGPAIVKENEQEAFDTAFGSETGAAAGKSTVAAPGDIAAGGVALDLIQQIRDNPVLKSATGFTAALNQIPGTDRFDFEKTVEQAKSGAFLTAIQQMRGLGQLSNAEGQTATAAVTRMNTSQTQEGFLKALSDYENIVKQGVERAQAKLGTGGGAGAQDVDEILKGLGL